MNENGQYQLMLKILKVLDEHQFGGELFLTPDIFSSRYTQDEINLIASSLESKGYIVATLNEGNNAKFFLASSLTSKGRSFLKKLE